MFEANAEYGAMIDKLYDICEGLERGDVLRHEVIRGVLGCEPHEGHWQHCVDRVREKLLDERGIDSWPDRTVGYRLMIVQEQLLEAPVRRKRRAMRQYRRTRKSLVAIPDCNLTQHQRRMKLFLVDATRKGEAAIRREIKESAQVVRATPVNPRRPIP